MTSTQKTPAAKPAAKPAAPKVDAPDFSSLSVEDTEMPKIVRPRTEKENPLRDHVAKSYETSTAKTVTVPEAQAGEVKNMIRRAATSLKIGVRVVVGDPVDGKVTVKFLGKPKTERKPVVTAAPAAPAV